MQFDVKEVDSIKRQVTVTMDPEELKQIENNLLRKLQKTASIPGFRKGHIPLGLIRKSYADTIRLEVLETAISEGYDKVLHQVDFSPIAQGKISEVKFEDVASGLTFEIEFEIQPEIELKKYQGLKVEKRVIKVTEEMVDEELEGIRQRFATVKPVEKAREGDIIRFNAQLLGEGDVPVIGRKFEDVEVVIGSGEFDPDLEKQMIGLELDQDAVVQKITPPPPDRQDAQPEVERYEITVTSLEERELPPLDDELAKNLQDEKIETLEQLRTVLRENIQSALDRRSESLLNNNLIDELLKENPFDVPEAMVENYMQYVLEDLRLQYKYQKIDENIVRQRYRVDAIHAIRWHLLRRALVKAENLTVSHEDAYEEIDRSSYSDEEKDTFKKNHDLVHRVMDDLQEKKILDFLKDHAEISEVEETPQEKES